jgi:hypothetical protein
MMNLPMSMLNQRAPAQSTAPNAAQQRVNTAGHAIVNHGIAVQSSLNTVCAVEYMKSHNIDPDVIERVLLHPEQRRKIAS